MDNPSVISSASCSGGCGGCACESMAAARPKDGVWSGKLFVTVSAVVFLLPLLLAVFGAYSVSGNPAMQAPVTAGGFVIGAMLAALLTRFIPKPGARTDVNGHR